MVLFQNLQQVGALGGVAIPLIAIERQVVDIGTQRVRDRRNIRIIVQGDEVKRGEHHGIT